VKAAVLDAERQLAYRDVADPMPGDGEVLLEVRASAVCGSDVHRYLRGHRTYPMIMGHEAAGIVSAIGPGVDESLRGRHAALIPLVPCHACAQCRAGRFSACATYSFIGEIEAESAEAAETFMHIHGPDDLDDVELNFEELNNWDVEEDEE